MNFGLEVILSVNHHFRLECIKILLMILLLILSIVNKGMGFGASIINYYSSIRRIIDIIKLKYVGLCIRSLLTIWQTANWLVSLVLNSNWIDYCRYWPNITIYRWI